MIKLLKNIQTTTGNFLLRCTFLVSFVFCNHTVVAAQDVSIAIAERLKEQLLVEIVPTLDLREGGMCFFYPQGKNFVTRVAINCSRLFDSFLEDIVQDKTESSLFEPELYLRFKNIKNQRALIEILQSDFQIFKEIRQKEGGFATEKLGLVTVEIAKISQYFLSQNLEESNELTLAFQEVIGRYSEDVVLIFLSFHSEESVNRMTEELWRNSQTIEPSGVRDRLLIELFLGILKGSSEVVVEDTISFFELHGEGTETIVESYSSYIPDVGKERFDYAKRTVSLIELCQFRPTIPLVESCEADAIAIALKLEEFIAKNYYNNLTEWFHSIPESEILEKVDTSLLRFESSEVSLNFLDSTLKPVLLKLNINDENSLSKACLLLKESPCSLNLQPSLNSNQFMKLVLFILLVLFSILSFFIFKRKQDKPKNESSEEKSSVELTPSERSELRELRSYFNLKPSDTVNELHKAYRKQVFGVHPDKLRDGGKEFVVLQANYLKAKKYLDKLDEVREKKISNG